MMKQESKRKKSYGKGVSEIHIDRYVKAKVSEGQWIIAGHEKLREG